MFSKEFVKRKCIHIALLLGATMLLTTACSNEQKTSGNVAEPTSATVNSASAIIKHSPSGTVELSWNQKTKELSVQLALTGLHPKSTHPAHIRAGSCKNGGEVVHKLTNVKADNIGFANMLMKIKDVEEGIPETGWFVDVSNGPGMEEDAEAMPITCANVFNPTASTKAAQTVQATLSDAYAPNQSASGNAQLSIDGKTLTVTLSVKGLVPNSKHAARLHTGSCASQGKLVHELKPITVNAAGEGTSTTKIEKVEAIPRSGWYVNIHNGEKTDNQTSADPIACGDITSLR